MKRYILIAGVNGAGKTTLYDAMPSLLSMPRINVDEIVREIGRWDSPQDVMQAGKIAVRKVDQLFKEGSSFNQEKTLCGKSIERYVDFAKAHQYHVEMYYIGLQSVELAKERVLHRVKAGGHGIPEREIERRYQESFHNFLKILPKCDLTAVYDNTDKFRRFAIYRNGNLVRLSKHVPGWYEEYICKGKKDVK